MVTVVELLGRLDRVKKNGRGWMARCPAHEDTSPSLSIAKGDDGRVLLHCHAGCTTVAITEALGFALADLFVAETNIGSTIVATYDYVDETGVLLYQTVRFVPKDFRQRRPDGKGGWIWNLGNTRRVLYRLPEVLAAVKAGKTVFVVEGEKDADNLSCEGVVATCNPMGAGKWRSEYAETLRNADIVVVADRDGAGREHAKKVVASLNAVTKTVRVVEPSEGKDVSDHLAAGKAVDELERPARLRVPRPR